MLFTDMKSKTEERRRRSAAMTNGTCAAVLHNMSFSLADKLIAPMFSSSLHRALIRQVKEVMSELSCSK